MRKYFTLFMYISLVFLAVALVKADFLFLPSIHAPGKLLVAMGLLFMGFFADTLAWHRTVRISGYSSISLRHAISSMGLSVFGKYIPGKLWVVLGRAGYLVEKYGWSKKEIGALSVQAQLISLWSGLFMGGLGIFFIGDESWYGTAGLTLWAFLTIVLFTPLPHRIFQQAIHMLFKKDLSIPFLATQSTLQVLPWYFLNWLLWIASFYFFVDAITLGEAGILTGFAFPIAATLGILVLIAPGGIGVREGVLFVFLMACGLNTPEATTVAAASRLWFLTGECFVFILGFLFNKNS